MGAWPAGRGGRAAGPGAGSASSPRCGRRPSTTCLRRPRGHVAARRARRPGGSADRSRCGPAFDQFALDYQVTGRFGECLDRLKERLADPVGDRVVEGLRIAREVGGGELGRLLRNLSGYLREDARTRSELESRQAWTVNGARLAVAAPWLVLLLMSFQSEVIHRYASPAGVVVLGVGAVLCVVAYRLMMRIGRLPDRAADPVVTPADVGCAARGDAARPGCSWSPRGSGRSAVRSSAVRVLPYVRDLPQLGARRTAGRLPAPTSAASGVFGPVLRSAADAVERVLGGAASVRRRLERAGLDMTVHEFRIEQVRLGAGRLRARRGVRPAPDAHRPRVGRARLAGRSARSRSSPACSPATTSSPARSRARERRILAEFPTVAELLALAVAAGEGPVAALDRVVRRSGGELSRDLGPGAGRRSAPASRSAAAFDGWPRRPGCRWWPASPRASPSPSSAARRSPTCCTPRPPTSARPGAAS